MPFNKVGLNEVPSFIFTSAASIYFKKGIGKAQGTVKRNTRRNKVRKGKQVNPEQ